MISRVFLVMGFKGISDKASTVMCAPSRLPSSLVTFFNSSDILLKAFIMFIANWTDIVVYKDQIWMKKIQFEWLIASHFMVAVQHFLFSGMAADLFLIRKYSVTSTKSFHDCFSIWLGAYVKKKKCETWIFNQIFNVRICEYALLTETGLEKLDCRTVFP